MNAMKMLLRGSVKFVKGKLAVLVLAAMILAPVATFSQEPPEEDPAAVSTDPQAETTPSSTSTGPWQGSTGASVGTPDNNSNTNPDATAAAPRLNSRPGAGPTTDDRDPGGNPDVPFDDNMNLVFLAAGLVFAFVIVRRRLKLNPATVSSKQ